MLAATDKSARFGVVAAVLFFGPMFRWPLKGKPARAGLARQMMLIVPPVVVLAIVALVSLRQDRASIEQDARANALVLAPDLGRRLGVRVEVELGSLVPDACSPTGLEAPSTVPSLARVPGVPMCGLVINSRIRVPLDYPALPAPPDWLRDMSAAEARSWRSLSATAVASDPATLRRTAAALSTASGDVRANAEWAILRAEVNRARTPATTDRLIDLARRSAGVTTETGVSLSALALLVAADGLPGGDPPAVFVSELRRQVVEQPSFLTTTLFESMGRRPRRPDSIARLGARWSASERALQLLRDLRPAGTRGSEAWLAIGNDAVVAFVHPLMSGGAEPTPERGAYHVTLVPSAVLDRIFSAAVSDIVEIPDYATAAISLGGRTWNTGARMPASGASTELASAEGHFSLPISLPADTVPIFAGELSRVAPEAFSVPRPTPGGSVVLNGEPGVHRFSVALNLTDPDRLYAKYRLRLSLAIGLVLAATLAVAGGLGSTWRSFDRQRRLGEMKSNFVASVSHELRAPIAAVRLMTESLERGTIADEARRMDYYRVIGEELRRLSTLVENILDFSRIDRGDRQYIFAPADIDGLVARIIELMQPYAAERQVSLVGAPSAGPVGAGERRVDREALEQALVNLVDNAIKHSPPGADVVVGLEADQAAIRIFVADQGPGIPRDQHERIFEPFFRQGPELRRETRGVGIGLSIARHAVEAHGGRIIVESGPGLGSRFTIELPVAAEEKS